MDSVGSCWILLASVRFCWILLGAEGEGVRNGSPMRPRGPTKSLGGEGEGGGLGKGDCKNWSAAMVLPGALAWGGEALVRIGPPFGSRSALQDAYAVVVVIQKGN